MLLRDLLLEQFGADRDGPWQQSPPVLNHLLNEMDGLGPDARGLGLADETAAVLSRRIGKVSPAFIKELCRRAAQEMLERGAGTLQDRDFERSLQDLRLRPKGLSPVREKVRFAG